MLCRIRTAALGLLVLGAGADPVAAARISVEKSKCIAGAIRVEADRLAPHENPADEMSRSAMTACPSGFGIVEAQTLSGGTMIVWSVRCSAWEKPSSMSRAPC
jgi:hypothetical protein